MRHRAACVVLGLLLLGLTAPVRAEEGNLVIPYRKHHCPPSMYSCLNYWAPSVYRIRACLAPRGPYIWPQPDCSAMPANYRYQTFPCQGVNPRDLPYGDLPIAYAPGLATPAPAQQEVPPAALTPPEGEPNPGAIVPGEPNTYTPKQ